MYLKLQLFGYGQKNNKEFSKGKVSDTEIWQHQTPCTENWYQDWQVGKFKEWSRIQTPRSLVITVSRLGGVWLLAKNWCVIFQAQPQTITKLFPSRLQRRELSTLKQVAHKDSGHSWCIASALQLKRVALRDSGPSDWPCSYACLCSLPRSIHLKTFLWETGSSLPEASLKHLCLGFLKSRERPLKTLCMLIEYLIVFCFQFFFLSLSLAPRFMKSKKPFVQVSLCSERIFISWFS